IEPIKTASIFTLTNVGTHSSSSSHYCIVDPATGIYAEGNTLKDALSNLAQSGYYPPGAILCQSATNGFTSSFEKAGIITASTVVNRWEDKVDSIAGAVGNFSLGCMLASPVTGGASSLPGVIAGLPAMGWFSFRAIQHFYKKMKYEKEFVDVTSSDDRRELGLLAANILVKGKAGMIARGIGLGLMTSSDIWEFGRDFSELNGKQTGNSENEQKMTTSEFFLKRGGQLAASLAMNIYFGKKDIAGWKASKSAAPKYDHSLLTVDDIRERLRNPEIDGNEQLALVNALGRMENKRASQELFKIANTRHVGNASPYEFLSPEARELAGRFLETERRCASWAESLVERGKISESTEQNLFIIDSGYIITAAKDGPITPILHNLKRYGELLMTEDVWAELERQNKLGKIRKEHSTGKLIVSDETMRELREARYNGLIRVDPAQVSEAETSRLSAELSKRSPDSNSRVSKADVSIVNLARAMRKLFNVAVMSHDSDVSILLGGPGGVEVGSI
ncbi:MAG: hypothetical protein V1909_06930, partial [Candidatus Micrarchaeota archaeon]